MNFKPLELEDKVIFDKYLKPYSFLTCEYSFTNLFIWRKGCDIQYTIMNDALIIKKTDFNGRYHFMQPIGYNKNNLKELVEELISIKQIQKLDYLFKDVETPFLKDLEDVFPGKFSIVEDRDNFDYIYDSKKLATLSGNALHRKKNHYNAFIKKYDYRVEQLREELLEDCIMASREWCFKNECKGYVLYEMRSIIDLLKNMSSLDFTGIVVYVNDKPSAFTIGEKMNDNMAIIHTEKADSEVRGLYAFINKVFVETYFKDIPYINREQDLGIEGLRHAKESYQPIKLEAKYTVI
jgi:uncharacterized protein